MAKFSVRNKIRLIVKGASQSVIPNPQGIPTVVNLPSKEVELAPPIYETNDQEIIDRIRADQQFGVQEGIIEITEEEQEAIKIKEKKMREADEEIKENKKKRKSADHLH